MAARAAAAANDSHPRAKMPSGQPAGCQRYIYAVAAKRTDTSLDTPGSCMVTP
jgi:hypothetical protein